MHQRCLCDIHRTVFISHSEHFHTLLFSVDLQLFDRCRAIDVTGGKERFSSLGF
jgi:hypothetical protein